MLFNHKSQSTVATKLVDFLKTTMTDLTDADNAYENLGIKLVLRSFINVAQHKRTSDDDILNQSILLYTLVLVFSDF